MIKDKLFCLFCLGTHYNQYECVYDVNDVYYRGWSYHLISLCMYVCIYIYMYVCICMHICVHMYIYIYVCVCCVYTHVYVYMYHHVPMVRAHMSIYIYIHMYVCTHFVSFLTWRWGLGGVGKVSWS